MLVNFILKEVILKYLFCYILSVIALAVPLFLNIEANKKEYIIDMRKKQFSLDNISNSNKEDTTLIIQPSLKNELNLETNMFAAYPQSNIPFSYSNSWIGM